jgi:hypothetical protein
MPKQGENVFPIPVSPEAVADLKTVMDVSKLPKTHVLRYAIEAALRTLAACDHVRLPIQFTIKNGCAALTSPPDSEVIERRVPVRRLEPPSEDASPKKKPRSQR